MKKIITWCKQEAVLCIAIILAVASMFFVKPDISNSVLLDGCDGRASESGLVLFCSRTITGKSEAYSWTGIHFDYAMLFFKHADYK